MTDSKEWCDGDWRCRSSSKPFAGAESGSPGRALEAGKRGSPGRPVQAGIRGKRLRVLCRVFVSCSASDCCSVVSTGPEECCRQVQRVTTNHAAPGRQSVDEEGVDGACIRLPHYT